MSDPDDDFIPAPDDFGGDENDPGRLPGQVAPAVQSGPVPRAAPAYERNAERAATLRDQERYLLGCCVLDDGETLDRCIEAGLTPADITDRQHALMFATLCRMRADGTPITVADLVATLGKRIKEAGGVQNVMGIEHSTTSAHASRTVQHLLDASELRRLDRISREAQEAVARGATPDEVAGILARAQDTRSAKAKTPPPRPITSYAYPSDDDPNMLLGSDDYLGRGGGLLFVSHAGAGKSSWALDAVMTWGLGEPWMGIRAAKPLKTLVVQSEDSARYIGKIFGSFAHVRKLTPEQTSTLSQNVVVVHLKGVSGDAFFTELRRLVATHSPDLVVINPLYLYADGDITRSEYAQPFLMNLDAINKEERFAYILIHHTGKPAAKNPNGKRASVEDWESAYMGFGSSYLANWPRATILLEPVAGHMGRYQIKLGKGGLNAGVTRSVPQGAGQREEPTTRIAIKHSDEKMLVSGRERRVFYWELDLHPPDQEEAPLRQAHGGRAVKHQFSDVASVFPKKDSRGLTLSELHRVVETCVPITRNSLHTVLKRWADENHVETIKADGQPTRYRALV